jgi:hypothetical protein
VQKEAELENYNEKLKMRNLYRTGIRGRETKEEAVRF